MPDNNIPPQQDAYIPVPETQLDPYTNQYAQPQDQYLNQVQPELQQSQVLQEPVRKKKSKKKILIILLIIFLFLAGLIAAAIFIPVNNQSVASRAFDAIGSHNIAFGIDAIRYGGDISSLSSINISKPETCSALWGNYADKPIQIKTLQGKQTTVVEPQDLTYKDLLSLKSYFTYGLDFDNAEAQASIDVNLQADIKRLIELYVGLPGLSQNLSTIKFNTNAEGVINTSDGLFKINQSSLEGITKDKLEANLPDWYGGTTGLTTKQQQNVKNIIKDIQNIISTKPSNIISKDTGESLAQAICGSIEKVDVQMPLTQSFGYGDAQASAFVRPVVVYLKQDQKALLNNIKNVSLKLSADKTFRDYIVGQYETVNDMNQQIAEFTRQTYVPILRKDYEKAIDASLKQLKDTLNNLDISKIDTSTSNTSNNVTTVYLSMQDGNVYGSRSSQKLELPQSLIDTIDDRKIQNMLKSGITVTTETYDNKINQTLPSKAQNKYKSLSQFGDDFAKTSLGKETVNYFGSLISSSEQILRDQRRQNDIKYIRTILEQYKSVYKNYPDSVVLIFNSKNDTYNFLGSDITITQPGLSSVQNQIVVDPATSGILSCGVASTESKWSVGYKPDNKGGYYFCTTLENGQVYNASSNQKL